MNNWNDLSLKEKADVMKVAIGKGIYNLSDIRKAYNEYAEGGPEEILNKVNSSDANFVQRLKDPNRKYIQDWESNNIATHKLSVGTDEYGNNYIYPEVQEINGKLVDFTRPPYAWYAGMESAEQRGDTVRIPSLEDAIRFTEEYKKYYPEFNEYKHGGKIYIKPSHRGKFTELKKRTGHSASWFKENGTPAQKKMATFELNARKWKHGDGGPLIDLANHYTEGGPTDESNNIIDWIINEEGFNSKPENIGDGKITLGSGLTSPKWHKIYNKKGTWTAEDNRAAVAEEVENRRRWAEQNVPNWSELPSDSQNALLSYKYNYDFTPKNSPLMFQALRDKNWEEAARQMDATSDDPKFKDGLLARRQREQELFMKGINSMNAPEPEITEEIPQEESIYTPPQSVLDNIAANNGKYMITGYPALAAPQNMLMNALRSSIFGTYASKAMDWAKRNHLFENGGPLVNTADKYYR